MPVTSCPLALRLHLWQRGSRVLEKVPSPPQENSSQPLPPSALATWGKSFTLRFSQVATNEPLFTLPGAPCKPP